MVNNCKDYGVILKRFDCKGSFLVFILLYFYFISPAQWYLSFSIGSMCKLSHMSQSKNIILQNILFFKIDSQIKIAYFWDQTVFLFLSVLFSVIDFLGVGSFNSGI